MPFSLLLEKSTELAEIRSEYSNKSEEERMMAADFTYNSSIASQMFNDAIGRVSGKSFEDEPEWPGEVTALAIDPNFAPALLSVGSGEYIYGRLEEAMEHFSHLISLPENTEDLVVIIDKAGDFLLDRKDYQNAIKFYSLASEYHPSKAVFQDALSYCFYKTKQFEKAIEHGSLAVKLEPNNHEYLSNLGWALVETSDYDKAEEILNKAVALAPEDYRMAKGNLEELKRRKKKNLNS